VAQVADQKADHHQGHVRADGLREDPCNRHGGIIIGRVPATPQPSSVAEVKEALGRVGYLADEPAALVAYLAQQLGKPVLVEGPAGVGKTELAKAISRATERPLIRLQCYEGLDASHALYEWNYPKQLLRIKVGEASHAALDGIDRELFSEPYLIRRPLLEAISADGEQPPVLLIDEVDRADEEFEAFLLEVLSDFQITIPELGTIRAQHRPHVVLTSNRVRELSDALKRRCLYHWIDYPDAAKEREILRVKVPELGEPLAGQVVALVQALRGLRLEKPPGVAETLDWAVALLALGQQRVDAAALEATKGCLLKSTADFERLGNDLEHLLAAAGA
jgi:MoxR-like ATPase